MSFAVLILGVLFIGWLGMSRMALINENIQKVTDVLWSKVALAQKALSHSSRNSRITMQIFLLKDKGEITALLEQREKNTTAISELLKKIEASVNSEEEMALIAEIRKARTPYVDGYKRALNLLLNEDQPELARNLMTEEVTSSLVAYHHAWETFVEFEGSKMNEAGDLSDQYHATARQSMVTALLVTLVLTCGVAVFVTRETANEIENRQLAEARLLESQEGLERRVAERTAELVRVNEELAQESERSQALSHEAQASNRAKSAFLATMSHEIRTPMNGVLGFAELLLSTTLTEQQHTYGVTLKSAAENLLTIIDDILDFSKIEAGKLTIVPQPFDLFLTIQEVNALLSHRAQKKGLTLSLDYSDKIPHYIVADPIRVRQVLMNLIGNALKFTESGSVKINVSTTQKQGRDYLRIEVIDTGIGITKEQEVLLFQKFVQAEASTTDGLEALALA